MTNKILDGLVEKGEIRSYSLETLDENGIVTNVPIGSNNNERLTITLHSGSVIRINTLCSGCLENITLMIS